MAIGLSVISIIGRESNFNSAIAAVTGGGGEFRADRVGLGGGETEKIHGYIDIAIYNNCTYR